MEKQSLGSMIASLRKQRGMTQLDLAVKMGVTDKAVSKWERDLSCPDISLLPRLAELFGVSVDELMNAKGDRDRRDRQIKKRRGDVTDRFKGCGPCNGGRCCGTFIYGQAWRRTGIGYAGHRPRMPCFMYAV